MVGSRQNDRRIIGVMVKTLRVRGSITFNIQCSITSKLFVRSKQTGFWDNSINTGRTVFYSKRDGGSRSTHFFFLYMLLHVVRKLVVPLWDRGGQ